MEVKADEVEEVDDWELVVKNSPEHLRQLEGCDFLVSKAVQVNIHDQRKLQAKDRLDEDFAGKIQTCNEVIADVKQILETERNIKMSSCLTFKDLNESDSEIKENQPLGPFKLVEIDDLFLHRSSVREVQLKCKYGLIILAKTLENFQIWAKSKACVPDVKKSLEGRLFAYIEHEEGDEGGKQGYLLSVRSYNTTTVPNGIARRIYSNGDYYHGGMKDGDMHGHGIFTYQSGNVYVGNHEKDSKWGKGTFFFKRNNNFYDGDWNEDMQHGKGKMTYGDGSVYVGDFKNGKCFGQGKKTLKDGKIMEGTWFKNRLLEPNEEMPYDSEDDE